MKPCCKCGKEVLSGLIICGECNCEDQLPLRYYIDQLAEEIVLELQVDMCSLCIIGCCGQQQSGLTCRNGVKSLLLSKIDGYTENLKADMKRHKEYYAFLDNLLKSGEIDITVIRTRFITAFPQLTTYQLVPILTTWSDIRNLPKEGA